MAYPGGGPIYNAGSKALGHDGLTQPLQYTRILEHYGVEVSGQKTDSYFKGLLTDDTLDAAIITTGILNEDLKAVLQSGKFLLLGIPDTKALAALHPCFSSFTIPSGLYGEGSVPDKDIKTVAAAAFLAAKEDVSELLVTEVLAALYKYDMPLNFKIMMIEEEAKSWPLMPLHSASLRYFEPHKRIGLLEKYVSFISGIKELLLALI